ncbi:MAG: alpha-glucosidase domain-containing protein [Cytophagales bacterium]|nr:alpha-glucosidase domain-containing protein [Cytophagales bacterium]
MNIFLSYKPSNVFINLTKFIKDDLLELSVTLPLEDSKYRFTRAVIFRITITNQNQFEDFSYSVVSKPKSTSLEIIDSVDSLLLKTATTQLLIAKSPIRFSFQTVNGEILNEDDPLGTSRFMRRVPPIKNSCERFIGLGEKTGPLDRKGNAYLNWNSDAYAYSKGTDPLYCSMPFYIGIHNGLCYGVFFDNTHKAYFNLRIMQ